MPLVTPREVRGNWSLSNWKLENHQWKQWSYHKKLLLESKRELNLQYGVDRGYVDRAMFRTKEQSSEMTFGRYSEVTLGSKERSMKKYEKKNGTCEKNKYSGEWGCWNLQGSAQPFRDINSEKHLAIGEGGDTLEAELSRDGSITQFKSPPNIKRCVLRQGILLSKLLANAVLSELGAYILAIITGVCQRVPVMI